MRNPVCRLPILPLAVVLTIVQPLPSTTAEPFVPRTRVTIDEGFWAINGKATYPGTPAEGLLMNVRMVNSTFEDRNSESCPKGFDPAGNTKAFLRRLPEYLEQGVLAFTLNLQGGMPGYEGALNSAFAPDGGLRAQYVERVQKVIEACDRLGAAVFLGLFYQRQDQVLRDEKAVRRAVVEATNWVKKRGYTNVLIEIANEHTHGGFDHKIIRDPEGCAALIALAKETAPGLLVSASGLGNGRVSNPVLNAADFVLLHFNSTPVDRIFTMVVKAGKVSKAVVCNEDDKTGEEGAAACEAAVKSLCSWGYMNSKKNQYYPFEFDGSADDPVVYAKIRALTRPEGQPSPPPAAPERARLESVKMIWDAGRHNAFTDLVRHGGRWFCVFREGKGHVSPDGTVRVLTSEDGDAWGSAAELRIEGIDLRDPKICVTPDDRLMLLAGAAKRVGSQRATEHRSVVTFSRDGERWGSFHDVVERNLWLWRVTWVKERGYGIAYGSQNPDGSRAPRPFTRLYSTNDGIHFETVVPVLHDGDYPNETKVVFLEDKTALCLMRRDGGSRSALLGRAAPPYREWTWKDLGCYLGGPDLIHLPDGRFLAAGRRLEGGAHTSLHWLDEKNGRLDEFLKLPSGGDTSYPGLVFHDGLLWVSYYASHEGKTSVYLARVRLPAPG